MKMGLKSVSELWDTLLYSTVFYVRAKQLITASIQSVYIFNFKTMSENCDVKLNAFKNPELCMEVGLESQ